MHAHVARHPVTEADDHLARVLKVRVLLVSEPDGVTLVVLASYAEVDVGSPEHPHVFAVVVVGVDFHLQGKPANCFSFCCCCCSFLAGAASYMFMIIWGE